MADLDGLDAYRAIFSQAKSHLKAGGKIYAEIGFDQLDSCIELAVDLGWPSCGRRMILPDCQEFWCWKKQKMKVDNATFTLFAEKAWNLASKQIVSTMCRGGDFESRLLH